MTRFKNLIFVLFLMPALAHSQSRDLVEVEWTLYPNYDLPDTLNSGDSLTFVRNDSRDFNPVITLMIHSDGRASSSMTSSSYETKNGIILNRDPPEPIYTIQRDTIITDSSIIVNELKVPAFIQVLHGPAIETASEIDMSTIDVSFESGIIIGYGQGQNLHGRFTYRVEKNKLVLFKE
ncbi:MAG: hypothetical protein ACI837_000861 [Crocinitomicaceae bacterium]|jgi:hypothetical protein